MNRRDKKSDTIKFRVPWRLKRDFMAKASREGRSASDLFREMMEDYLRRPAQRATQTLETAMTTIRKHPRRSGAAAAILGAAGISALLAGAIPAGAQSALQIMFEQQDANGDGVLTPDEMGLLGARAQWRPGPADAPRPEGTPSSPDEIAAMILAEFDTDGDGGLSMEEFAAQHQSRIDSFFAILDLDGDGEIRLEDEAVIEPLDAAGQPTAGYAIDLRSTIRVTDADGDGRVTRAELEAYVGVPMSPFP